MAWHVATYLFHSIPREDVMAFPDREPLIGKLIHHTPKVCWTFRNGMTKYPSVLHTMFPITVNKGPCQEGDMDRARSPASGLLLGQISFIIPSNVDKASKPTRKLVGSHIIRVQKQKPRLPKFASSIIRAMLDCYLM